MDNFVNTRKNFPVGNADTPTRVLAAKVSKAFLSKGYKPSLVLMIRVAEKGEKVKQSTFAALK